MTMLRAVRGATTVPDNQRQEILDATRELLGAMLEANGLEPDQLVFAMFSGTPDLDAAFPAAAARDMGWSDVPLFGAQELAVEEAPPHCIRVMLLAEMNGPSQHVYLRQAALLRPDLSSSGATGDSPSPAGSGDGSLPLSFPSSPYSYFYHYR